MIAYRILEQKTEHIELLETFVSYCLIHLTTSFNWRYEAFCVAIFEISTEFDEVLCILLLENKATDYDVMHQGKWKIIENWQSQSIQKLSIYKSGFGIEPALYHNLNQAYFNRDRF